MMERVFMAVTELAAALASVGAEGDVLVELDHEDGHALLQTVHAYNSDVSPIVSADFEPELRIDILAGFMWEEVKICGVRVRWPAKPDEEPRCEVVDNAAWGKSEEVSIDGEVAAGFISGVPGDGE